jgi:hypothetical protein
MPTPDGGVSFQEHLFRLRKTQESLVNISSRDIFFNSFNCVAFSCRTGGSGMLEICNANS